MLSGYPGVALDVCVQVAPDGYRADVYAHCKRHDVEKRRLAPLIR